LCYNTTKIRRSQGLKVYKTAKLEILGSHIIEPTIRIYREALSFIIDVCYKEKAGWLTLEGKNRCSYIEKLIHATSKNPNPKYVEFDKKFYKMPTYLRRAIINQAIGIVNSYLALCDRYIDKKTKALSEGKKFTDKPPRLSYNHYSFPALYKNGMFDNFDIDGTCHIKLFIDNDWKYINIAFDKKALCSSKTFRFDGYTMDSPSLVFKSKRFYLNVPFYKNVELSKEQDIVIGVDLGITNSAVVSAVMKDGTVIDRLFINQPKEKDHLKYQLDRLNKANIMSSHKNKKPNIWRKINNLITAIATQTANDIVDFAEKNNAKVIVFEHLHFKDRKSDKKKKKLRSKKQYWTKSRIQEIVKNKAHSMGIRFSRVDARNTSALAFDGSGYVRRNPKGDIATFTTGKIYHADLNASYNIAARYFLRELERAKVPVRIDRTSQTLDTLINLAMRPHHPSKVA
jgi:transposase, IS605 orfB family